MARSLLGSRVMHVLRVCACAALVLGTTFATQAARAENEARGIDMPTRDVLPEETRDQDEEKKPHTGFAFGVSPGVAFDASNARPGFSVGLEGSYGAAFGPLVVAPGAVAMLFVPKGTTVVMGFPELKVLVPLGRFAPYAAFGVGIGADTSNGDAGVAVRGGGGVRYAFNDFVSLGLEGAYQEVTGINILTIGLGPVGHF